MWVRLGSVKGKAPKTLGGEIGILNHVRSYPDRPGRIYLTIDHEGAVYVGCLFFDDERFCEYMAEHLRQCYSMSIDAVGSSEIIATVRPS